MRENANKTGSEFENIIEDSKNKSQDLSEFSSGLWDYVLRLSLSLSHELPTFQHKVLMSCIDY